MKVNSYIYTMLLRCMFQTNFISQIIYLHYCKGFSTLYSSAKLLQAIIGNSSPYSPPCNMLQHVMSIYAGSFF